MSLRTTRRPPRRKVGMMTNLMRLMKKMKIASMKKKKWKTSSLLQGICKRTMIVSKITMTKLCREKKSTMKMMMTMMTLTSIIISNRMICSVPAGQMS